MNVVAEDGGGCLDIGEHLQAGLELCRGVNGLNSVVGDCVFNIFTTNTLSAILTSYASCTVLFARSSSHVLPLFSAMNAVLTSLFLGRLYQLTSTGQRLIRSLVVHHIIYYLCT